MVLGAILGPVGESAFMRSMISSGSDWTVFVRGPICGPLMVGSLLALSYPLLRELYNMRRRAAAVAISGEHR